MKILNSMLSEICGAIVKEAIDLVHLHNKSIISAHEVQTAVKLSFQGNMAKHAVIEALKAVNRYTMDRTGPQKERAGLRFPVPHFRKIIKANSSYHVGSTAPVYLAAVLEYLTTEILELAGNTAKDNKNVRITPRHIFLAVRSDVELDRMFKGIIPMGGTVPNTYIPRIGKGSS